MNRLRLWSRRLGILIGSAILVYQIASGWQAFHDRAVQVRHPALLLLSFGLTLLPILLQIVSWKILMQTVGVRIPYARVFFGYLLSFLPRYIPGTVWGYLSRNEWVVREYGGDHSRANLVSILEVLVFSLGYLFVIILALRAFEPGASLLAALAGILVTAAAAWLLTVRALRLNLAQRLFHIDGLRGSLRLDARSWGAAVLLFTLNGFLYGGALYLMYAAFGFAPGGPVWSQWSLFAGIYCVSWLIGFYILFLPSGLGARELALAFSLSSLLPVTYAQAAAVSVVLRFVTILSEVLCLGLALLLTRIIPKDY